MHKHSFRSLVAVLAIVLVSTTAIKAEAATNTEYQPGSVSELIAYLYGVIASLEAQAANKGVVTSTANSNNSSRNNTSVKTKTAVETLSATSIDRNEATLRSSVSFTSGSYAYASFEYGTSKSLDEETDEKKITKGSKSTVQINVEDLKTNTKYYYRAVMELSSGKKQYGEIKTFTTERTSSGSSSGSNSNSNNSSGDEMSTDADSYAKWSTITVELDLPSNLAFGAWIGLYSEGATNQSYIQWRGVKPEDKEITFSAPYTEGEFELRLFKDSGYTKIATSDTFTVK